MGRTAFKPARASALGFLTSGVGSSAAVVTAVIAKGGSGGARAGWSRLPNALIRGLNGARSAVNVSRGLAALYAATHARGFGPRSIPARARGPFIAVSSFIGSGVNAPGPSPGAACGQTRPGALPPARLRRAGADRDVAGSLAATLAVGGAQLASNVVHTSTREERSFCGVRVSRSGPYGLFGLNARGASAISILKHTGPPVTRAAICRLSGSFSRACRFRRPVDCGGLAAVERSTVNAGVVGLRLAPQAMAGLGWFSSGCRAAGCGSLCYGALAGGSREATASRVFSDTVEALVARALMDAYAVGNARALTDTYGVVTERGAASKRLGPAGGAIGSVDLCRAVVGTQVKLGVLRVGMLPWRVVGF